MSPQYQPSQAKSSPSSQNQSPGLNQSNREQLAPEEPTLPKQESEYVEHVERSKIMLALVKDARSNGHTLNFSKDLYVLSDSEAEIDGLKEEKLFAQYELLRARTASTIAVEFFDQSSSLLASNPGLKVRPFAVSIKQTAENAALVEVRDLLTPGAPKVFSQEIQGRRTEPSEQLQDSLLINGNPDRLAAILGGIIAGQRTGATPAKTTPTLTQSYEKLVAGPIAELQEKKIADAQRRANALPEDPQRLFRGQVRLATEVGPDENQRQVIAEALKTDYSVSIQVQLNESGDRIDLQIKPELIAQHSEKAIEVDGEIEKLVLHKLSKVELFKSDYADVLSRVVSSKPEEEESQENSEPSSKEGFDRFGNKVFQIKNEYFESVYVNIKRDSDTVHGDGKRVVTVGAPEKGIPELTGLLVDHEGKPVEYQGKPKLITLDPARTLTEAEIAKINLFEQGAQNTLAQFGAGDLVRRIFVINSAEQNAYFRESDSSSIFVTDEMLSESPESLDYIGRHEAIHLLDSHFGRALSAGSLAELHGELESENLARQLLGKAESSEVDKSGADFFTALNESNFLETGTGGHSQDNPSEFAATAINSLNHPNWESRVNTHSKEFQKNYHQTLLAVREQLQTVQAVASDAPIRGDLDKKIDYLAKLVGSNSADDAQLDSRQSEIRDFSRSIQESGKQPSTIEETGGDPTIGLDLMKLTLPSPPSQR